VDGLLKDWANDALRYDFATIIMRWKLLGFNAIRLPFSFKDLSLQNPPSLASNCTLYSFSTIAYSVTDPQDDVPLGLDFPELDYWPVHMRGRCNDYLPSDSVRNRFVWVVQFLARNGFYVIM
jgi:hypothetical protein